MADPFKPRSTGRRPQVDPVDLDAYLTATVYPALFNRLDTAFPDFGWTKSGDAWVATRWPSSFPQAAEHKHPDRLMVYADRPWWVKVHGHGGVRFLDLVNDGRKPKGTEFLDAVRKLSALAGVPCPLDERTVSAEEREHARAGKPAAPSSKISSPSARRSSGLPAGSKARSYLRDGRGLTDEEIRELDLGLCLSAADFHKALLARGHSLEACKDAGVLRRRLEGFILIPWADEHGRPMTVYGRWQEKTPPPMKDHDAYGRKRDELLAAWRERNDGTPWEEPRIPKTTALAGKGTKASPFCYDRARRAGCRDAVLLEGVFDAALLQVRGDSRAVASAAAQLSGEQLKTLQRCRVERVFVCGDPDGGGDRGTLANVEALTGACILAYVVPRLPDGMDPDEFVREGGIDAWLKWVSRAEHAYRYRARLILDKHRPADGIWTDPTGDAAVHEALEFDERQTVEKTDELARHFWPVIQEAIPSADMDALLARRQILQEKKTREWEHAACQKVVRDAGRALDAGKTDEAKEILREEVSRLRGEEHLLKADPVLSVAEELDAHEKHLER